MGKFNYFSYKEKGLDKLSPAKQADLVFDLISAFSLVRSPVETALLLQDLLTEDEIRDISKRLRIAKLLLRGHTTEEIAKELHCSFATVTKVRIWLSNAGEGLRKVVTKLPERKSVYRPKRTPGVGYGLPQILLHFASLYMTKQEAKRLEKFLGEMRAKTAADKDFREETSAEFAKKRRRKRQR